MNVSGIPLTLMPDIPFPPSPHEQIPPVFQGSGQMSSLTCYLSTMIHTSLTSHGWVSLMASLQSGKYIYIYLHIHVYLFTNMHVYTHIYTCMRIRWKLWRETQRFVCTHVCMRTHTHIHPHRVSNIYGTNEQSCIFPTHQKLIEMISMSLFQNNAHKRYGIIESSPYMTHWYFLSFFG